VEELKWMPDGQSIVVQATNKPASDQFTNGLYSIWLRGGMDELRAPRGPINDLKISPDGKQVSFAAAREDGPSPHDLWLIGSEGGVARNLTGASLDRPVGNYHWAKDGSLTLLYSEGFRNKFAVYSQTGERKDLPDVPANPGEFDLASTGEIAFVGQTSVAPQELWLRDAEGQAQQVTHLNESLKPFGLIAPEFYKYKSFDGLEIEAGLLKPADYDGRSKLPTIVLVHGGPTGNWRDAVDIWGQLLVARGYAVLYPNVRGSIGYGEKFMEMNRADWGGGDFKDVMSGVEDLVTKGIADPKRLGIGGWSYGGYMAAWAVTQTARFRAAVSGAPVIDMASEFGTEDGSAYDEWFYGTPYERLDGFIKSSPITHVKNVKTPTLLLQGEDDLTDPMGQSRQFYRGLKRYQVDTDLVLYPREPHGLREEKHLLDRMNRVIGWFDKYLREN
jgi:dipeptidyl aminopeptidase/acylaminoacyl peptidase